MLCKVGKAKTNPFGLLRNLWQLIVALKVPCNDHQPAHSYVPLSAPMVASTPEAL